MKNLYTKGKIHPSPPQLDYLSVLRSLPATILALTVTLLPEDQEVLAYLVAGSVNTDGRKNRPSGKGKHPPMFHCNCFQCYTSFWARWDSSPNRQLIHEIIDAFEESLQVPKLRQKGKRAGRKDKRFSGEVLAGKEDCDKKVEAVKKGFDKDGENNEDGEIGGKSSLRKFVSFIGENLWGIWNAE